MTFIVYGVPTAHEIAIGPIHLLEATRPESVAPRQNISDVSFEEKRLITGIERTNGYLQSVKDSIPPSAPREIVSFVDTHIQIVCDETLLASVVSLIKRNHCNSEWALNLYQKNLLVVFEQMQDVYFEARKADICHVIDLILTNLHVSDNGTKPSKPLRKNSIVVARDLNPSDVILLFRQGISGFLIEIGASSSHTSILARSLGLPFVIGILNARKLFRDNDVVIVDGEIGVAIGEPDPQTLSYYRKKEKKINFKKGLYLKPRKEKDVVSADGKEINISFNLDMVADIGAILKYGNNPIGLFRTEFLFLNRLDIPTEFEHLTLYKKILQSTKNRELTIRTADIGPEKVPQSQKDSFAEGSNSALGLRGLRFSLKKPKIFLPQLRAIIRASAFGKIRLMLPMVTDLSEISQVKELVLEIRREFEQDGIAFDKNIPIGAMIEVPAAAAAGSLFAAELDFLSIGSNDLIQYANAADRQNSDVAYLYQPLHFGFLTLMSWLIMAADKLRKPIFICGEMASDSRYTALLLGLGLTKLSVRPAVARELEEKIRNISVEESKKSVQEFLASGNTKILELLVGE